MSKVKIFGTIEKVDDQDDGTIIVHGIASSEAVDSQGEVVTAEAMKAAIPGYMAVGGTGAVREMHQPSAAGVTLKCYVGDDNLTRIEAHIVKDEAVKLVKHGVYKGFSIGGKVTKRDDLNKNTITGLRLTEISLVDVPSNPEAVFSLGKVAGDDEVVLGSLRKGMYDVSNFAEMIQRLAYLAGWSQNESEYESDNSPVPARLGAWVADGCAILQAMTEEEVAELIATLPKGPIGVTVDVVEMGEGTGDLAKKGAKFSSATAKALGDLHEIVKAADKQLTALDYNAKADEEDTGEKSTQVEDLKKAADDTTAKVETLTSELAKAASENTELKSQIEKLKQLPAPAKGSVTAVSKSGDAVTPAATQSLEPIRKGDGTVDEVATLIKATHRGLAAN